MKQRTIIFLVAFLAIAAVAFAVVPLYLYSDEPAWPFFIGAVFCTILALTVWMGQEEAGVNRSGVERGGEEERTV